MNNNIRPVRKVFDSFCPADVVGNVNQWRKFKDARPNRIGLIIQNQHQTAKFWVADGNKARLTDGVSYSPSTGTVEDYFADQGEIWVLCDTVGAFLTITEKFFGD